MASGAGAGAMASGPGGGAAGAWPTRWLLHLACVAALCWPALVNRQPFFFPDTTSYIRAADLAVQLATDHRVTTAWSRPRAASPSPAPAATSAPSAAPAVARGSDGSGGGAVMAGRSPYFGALLYIGYVASDFWLFVVAQAIVAYWLIALSLRTFGLSGATIRTGVTLLLALLTPLAYYCGLLLADALAGFGILAFVLLATVRSSLSAREAAGLVALLLVSVLAHLTHIVMLAAMVASLVGWALVRRGGWARVRGPALVGSGIVVVGLASVTLTAQVVRAALGKPPALVPLMTARFVADGPGQDYIAAGCDGGRFVVCHLPFTGHGSTAWLWSREPGTGVFLPADAATRARLSAEDTRFALAVLAAYPLRQGAMMLRNTGLQLVEFDSDIMAESCFARPECSGDALPPPVRATMRDSLGGQDRWPLRLIAAKDYTGVVAALAALAVLLPAGWRTDRMGAERLLAWIGLIGVAMLANAFFGGAISEPQGRYQARIVWLVPLLATIAWGRWRATRDGHARPLPAVRAAG